MTIRNSFLALLSALALFPSALRAQELFAYPVETQFHEGTLTVMLHAFFAFGAGSTCPSLTWDATIEQDTVHLRAYYDASGVWPYVGCDRYDTVRITPVDESLCILSIEYFEVYSGNGGSDTVAMNASEVVSFCTTGVMRRNHSRWSVYPTAFTDHVRLVSKVGSQLDARIELFDALGRKMFQLQRSVTAGDRIQLPTDLPDGPYWLVIEERDGRTSIPLQRIP